MNVQVLTEDNFNGHQGNDLFDPEKVNFRLFKVKKSATLIELMAILAESMVIFNIFHFFDLPRKYC